MRRLLVLALVATLAISIVGFAQVGTKDKPIYMLLPPSTDTTVIGPSGDKIAEYLFQETGLYVVPVVAADYAALAEAFRTADGDVFGIPTSSQYCQIYNETNGGIIPTMGAVRNGYVYYFASIYALRSKGYTSLADLSGKTWIYNDVGSGSGYKYPKVYMQQAGVQWANVVETGGHVNSMVALLQGQGDFCTGYGSPPLSPQCLKDQGIRWEWGDDPELMVWDHFNNALVRDGLRWACEDLRFAVLKDYPDVFTTVGVVSVVGPIPNDCLAFVSNFPADLVTKITNALVKQIGTPEGFEIWNNKKFYQWSGMAPVKDSDFDLMRAVLGLPVPAR
ncbi:MAG: PhnD/SsuA/transferrin family substrate-binding protein [Candidatus Bipolaricaulota bacterium]|nr:PhnD/SsuA/transferrin family substrate-binding protein [Candidatus Bipolaricaulota bacterium]